MNTSNFLRQAAVTALLVTSAGAFAAGGPLDLSSGSTGFAGTPPAGSFTDVFTFSLASPGVLSGSITSVVSGSQNLDFTSIVVSGPSGLFSFTSLLPDPFEVWGLPATLLAPGAYTLTLSGMNSPAVASYGGNIAVSPVPEPNNLALMLGGIGCIGVFMARRRKT